MGCGIVVFWVVVFWVVVFWVVVFWVTGNRSGAMGWVGNRLF